ncbi:tyrosine--tRNA ligase, partial [Sulfolobus sp. A20-N-F8]
NTIEGLEEDDIQAEIKMSKSKPESAVFVNDPPEDVERKIMGAYCPKGVVENNPIIQIIKYIIFTKYNSFKIERDIKYGGDIEFKSYEELEKMYIDGKIHPMDLKKATAKKLNEILDPIRRGLDKKSEYKDLIQIISKSVSR